MKFLHYFLPHPETHQKAKLLSWHFFFIYVLLFILLRVSLDIVSIFQPGVLGVNSTITVSEVIDQTNQQRSKLSLSNLKENDMLNQAAKAKALNMLEEDYWAHYAPSGKDPWSFIIGSGYKFSYAGENLARNFYTSDEVVKAWMNSPTHRDNIVNDKYQDIGIAVVDGVLLGQKTTLVVQMFGSPPNGATASVPEVKIDGKNIQISQAELAADNPVLSLTNTPDVSESLFDPLAITKGVGMALIGLIAVLLIFDFVVLKRRGVFRLSSNHFAHLSFLALTGTSLMTSSGGSIL